MTIKIEPGYRSEWPRAHNWYIGPLHIFRNPDAGITLAINGYQFGPGQCGERTWTKGRSVDLWCYRPFGHSGDHAYSVADTIKAKAEVRP